MQKRVTQSSKMRSSPEADDLVTWSKAVGSGVTAGNNLIYAAHNKREERKATKVFRGRLWSCGWRKAGWGQSDAARLRALPSNKMAVVFL